MSVAALGVCCQLDTSTPRGMPAGAPAANWGVAAPATRPRAPPVVAPVIDLASSTPLLGAVLGAGELVAVALDVGATADELGVAELEGAAPDAVAAWPGCGRRRCTRSRRRTPTATRSCTPWGCPRPRYRAAIGEGQRGTRKG